MPLCAGTCLFPEGRLRQNGHEIEQWGNVEGQYGLAGEECSLNPVVICSLYHRFMMRW